MIANKMMTNRMVLLAMVLLLGSTVFSFPVFKTSPTTDVADVVDKTAQRLGSYPEMSHWLASVRSRKTEMDKNWQPKKETIVQKTILMKDKTRQEKVHSAVEVKDGKKK